MRLLVLSSSSIVCVNRSYLRDLTRIFNFQIHLAILYKKSVVDSHKGIDDYNNEPFSVSIHELRGPHPRLETFDKIHRLVDQVRPDYILMEYDTASLITYSVLKLAKSNKIRVGTIIAENRYRNYIKEFFKFLIRFRIKNALGALLCYYFQRFSITRIDNIFPISKEACLVYEKYGFPNSIITQIPYGIDLKLFTKQDSVNRVEIRNKLGLNSFTIAYFGRLVPEKGVDILIKALAKIDNLKWQLLLDSFSIYPSEFVKHLDSLIMNYNLSDKIVHFDATHNEMPAYYNAVDLVVLPSIENSTFKEQYGRVLVESMACETLVIGSNTGAIGEMLNNSDLLFESNNIESLRKKIIEMMNLSIEKKVQILSLSSKRANSLLGTEHQAKIIGSLIKI